VTQEYTGITASGTEISIDAPEGYKIIYYNGPFAVQLATQYSMILPVVLTDTNLTMTVTQFGSPAQVMGLTIFCMKV
jgi:hypothetical protein